MSVLLRDIVFLTKGKKHDHFFTTSDNKRKANIQIEDLRNDYNVKYTDDTGVEVSQSDVIIAWDGANAGPIGFGLNGLIGSTLA